MYIVPEIVAITGWPSTRATVPSNGTPDDSPFTSTFVGTTASDASSPSDTAADGTDSLIVSPFTITSEPSNVTETSSLPVTTVYPSSDAIATSRFTMALLPSNITGTASPFTSTEDASTNAECGFAMVKADLVKADLKWMVKADLEWWTRFWNVESDFECWRRISNVEGGFGMSKDLS